MSFCESEKEEKKNGIVKGKINLRLLNFTQYFGTSYPNFQMMLSRVDYYYRKCK